MRKASNTKKLVYTATLTAICTAFNIFTFIPIKHLAISFVPLACFIAGAFLGPVHGLAVGFLGDLLGAIIHPLGPYMPLIGLAAGLLGFIPGLVFQFIKGNHYIKVVISFVLAMVICTSGLNTYALWSYYGKTSFMAYLFVRLPFQAIVSAINAILAAILYLPLHKYVFKQFLEEQNHEEKSKAQHCIDEVADN